MKKLLALLLAVVMVVGLMAACNGNGDDTKPSEDPKPSQGGSADTQPQATDPATEPTREHEERYGGHFNARIYSNPPSLDPMKNAGTWYYQYLTCIFEPALTRDADNNIQPGVCDYTLSDDELTLTLWVQDGVTFHNGDPVDIYDIEATFTRASTMYSHIKNKVWPYVESMEVQGDKLILKFTEVREEIMYRLASWQTWCAVQPKEICEKYTGTDNYNFDCIEDAIGTGPYKVTEFEMDISITVERYDGYKIRGEGLTGFAGPKYAYLDSITFYSNKDDSNATMALLAGDYDIVECIDSEYADLIAGEGIIETKWPSDQGMRLFFNTKSTASLVSKYPSLRKAIAAAIPFDEFCGVVSDYQHEMNGCPWLDPRYDTDIFITQDYYGDTNMEAVNKYLAAAKAEGWNGTDPVQVYRNSTRDDIPTLFKQYLTNAGIPVEVHILEAGALSDLKNQTESSVWDVDMDWVTWRHTPTTFTSTTYMNCPEYDALIAEMATLSPSSEEYIAKVMELSQVMVDDASIIYMTNNYWFWYHPAEFHPNDEGISRYYFNSYWDDPENHTR